VPVALVYLGFIAADEMKGRRLIANGEEWELIKGPCAGNRA
jgi:hypothetical protein